MRTLSSDLQEEVNTVVFFYLSHFLPHETKLLHFNTLDSAVLTPHYRSKTKIHLGDTVSLTSKHRSDNMKLRVIGAEAAPFSSALLSASVTLSSLLLLSGVFPLSQYVKHDGLSQLRNSSTVIHLYRMTCQHFCQLCVKHTEESDHTFLNHKSLYYATCLNLIYFLNSLLIITWLRDCPW